SGTNQVLGSAIFKSHVSIMKKNKSILSGIAAIALLVGLVSNASALTVTIDRVPNYFSGNGGEFNIAGAGAAILSNYNAVAKATNSFGQTGFETFCLETNE